MPQLVGHPAHALSSLERERGPSVPRGVQLQRTNPLLRGSPAHTPPHAIDVAGIGCGPGLRAEDPRGDLGPALQECASRRRCPKRSINSEPRLAGMATRLDLPLFGVVIPDNPTDLRTVSTQSSKSTSVHWSPRAS